jgi:hypothetical protein
MISQNSYFIDILNRTKVFEISVHKLAEPLPMVLFRGTASVRDSGFFFNIEASLHHPIGPFRTAEAIIQAAVGYIGSHNISCPSHVRQYIDLTDDDIRQNTTIRTSDKLTQLEKNAKLKRPLFYWTPHQSHSLPWNGLGLVYSKLVQHVQQAHNDFYLFPISMASESSIIWNDSSANQPGWKTHRYNHNTRNTPGGPIISTEIRDLFYRPELPGSSPIPAHDDK